MSDLIRCPHCKGAKKVPKLGGMIGECNGCNGKGQIKAEDKPKPIEIKVDDVSTKELVNAVADCVPASDINPYTDITQHGKLDVKPATPDVKIDGKKALYKRKTASR